MAEKMATRQAYGQALVEIGKTNPNLVVMDADLSKSTMTYEFSKAYPERFFNMGIAEQNMYAAAAGIALSGKVVCASTFAMFAAGRAFEIIRNSIGYTKANVKICATHAGMTVLNPGDAVSAKKLLEQAIELTGPVYVRLGRAAVPVCYDEHDEIQIGKACTLRDGGDLTIIATGIMVNEALIAADLLAEEGIRARVVDMHTIKPIDRECILKAARETGKIVTAEEHSVIGGLGSAVAEVTAQEYPVKIAMVGQKDTFGESGKPAELLEKYGMTAKDIVLAAKSL